MEEYHFEIPISNHRLLCVGPITRGEAEAANEEAEFCDGFGHYLFIADEQEPRGDVEIVAKLVSEEAAVRLSGLLRARRAL